MIDQEAKSKYDIIAEMGQRLFEGGYVTSDFVESVLEREKQFPTGLPTLPYGVAIPHTDTDKVVESKIAFATLKEPVSFTVMGSSGIEIGVKIVFMLALKDAESQLSTLQKLIELVQDKESLTRLNGVKSARQLNAIFN